MSNRVENSPSHPSTGRTGESTEPGEIDDANESESADESAETASPAEKTGIRDDDVWEEATNPYGDVLEKSTGESSNSVRSGGVEADEAMAVWEMMEPEGADAAAAGVGDGEFRIEDNRAADRIAGMYDDLVDRGVHPRDVGGEFNIQVFDGLDGSGRESLVELAGHTDELRARLVERGGDPALADAIAGEVESRVVSMAGERIADRARPGIREGIESVDRINDSSESRRAFLAGVADGADGPDEIAQGLAAFGIEPSVADDAADVLADIGDDEEAMEAFVAGAPGDDAGLLQFEGEYEEVEEEIESELDSIRQGLESLDEDLDRNQIQHDRFLTDPAVAPIREEVLDEMGAVTEPPDEVNGLGEVFNEATSASESAQFRENAAIVTVNLTTAAVATLATAGLGGPAAVAAGGATAAAQEVPNVAEADLEADLARGEVAADLGSPELIEEAEEDKNFAFAVAVGSVVTGGALGGAVDDAAVGTAGSAVSEGASTALHD